MEQHPLQQELGSILSTISFSYGPAVTTAAPKMEAQPRNGLHDGAVPTKSSAYGSTQRTTPPPSSRGSAFQPPRPVAHNAPPSSHNPPPPEPLSGARAKHPSPKSGRTSTRTASNSKSPKSSTRNPALLPPRVDESRVPLPPSPLNRYLSDGDRGKITPFMLAYERSNRRPSIQPPSGAPAQPRVGTPPLDDDVVWKDSSPNSRGGSGIYLATPHRKGSAVSFSTPQRLHTINKNADQDVQSVGSNRIHSRRGSVAQYEWRKEICQMMFVSGETSDVSPETTSMIENIVQQQVMEMLKRATDLAGRRGVRTISTDDLIFLIRHDKAKVSRLRTFLSWKDVRKSAKDSDEKGGGGGDAGGVDDFDLAANDPTLGQGPSVGTRNSKNKKAKVGLPWDVSSFYSEQVPERDDEEDEEEEEMNAATLQRLKQADERTKGMNAEEYLHFSECRQASFTFRKGKRFREWAGFGVVTDSKPNDDIVDILGFLTYEIVTLLTEEALKVKAAEDALKRESGGDEEKRSRKRRREPGLFDPPEEARSPVGTGHIQEAYRRLQRPELKSRYMHHIPKGNWQRPLKLI
ncbi:Transcription initiation protein spt3 [Elasticomyces elasticus]|nr:Transcription initiation protein spt3 [Elasticomyces elasticus]KAK3627490.1 Transcription initiation protein spt3 [Elasticomyces elasticus]KAK4917215.1 Transcription initiation protein spt3 [Elasticomyces elasticus]KAK5746718.1 Transcription initiation protein spt3 [Elasticomyces elasticus]